MVQILSQCWVTKKRNSQKEKNNNFKVHFSGFHVAASLTIVTTIDVLLSIIIFIIYSFINSIVIYFMLTIHPWPPLWSSLNVPPTALPDWFHITSNSLSTVGGCAWPADESRAVCQREGSRYSPTYDHNLMIYFYDDKHYTWKESTARVHKEITLNRCRAVFPSHPPSISVLLRHIYQRQTSCKQEDGAGSSHAVAALLPVLQAVLLFKTEW